MRSSAYDVERSGYLDTNMNDRYCKSVNRNTIIYATSAAIVYIQHSNHGPRSFTIARICAIFLHSIHRCKRESVTRLLNQYHIFVLI